MHQELPRLCRLLVLSATAATLALAGTAAAAQYQWRDAGGRMVYSDRPPPASVDAGRIVSAPAGGKPTASVTPPVAPAAAGTAAAPAGAALAGAAAAAVTPPNQTLAERDLAYRKRLAEKAEQEKKALEASQRQLELAKACADTQSDIRSLESGQRISRINAAGDREFLSEAERADRLKDARKNVGERC